MRYRHFIGSIQESNFVGSKMINSGNSMFAIESHKSSSFPLGKSGCFVQERSIPQIYHPGVNTRNVLLTTGFGGRGQSFLNFLKVNGPHKRAQMSQKRSGADPDYCDYC